MFQRSISAGDSLPQSHPASGLGVRSLDVLPDLKEKVK